MLANDLHVMELFRGTTTAVKERECAFLKRILSEKNEQLSEINGILEDLHEFVSRLKQQRNAMT